MPSKPFGGDCRLSFDAGKPKGHILAYIVVQASYHLGKIAIYGTKIIRSWPLADYPIQYNILS